MLSDGTCKKYNAFSPVQTTRLSTHTKKSAFKDSDDKNGIAIPSPRTHKTFNVINVSSGLLSHLLLKNLT